MVTGTDNLRLEWRSPAELAENPRNWRRHPEPQLAALSDVLSEVGWAGACLYNERTSRLIDGHARRKLAQEQGADKVPVLVGSWDEAQEAKILATLDPLGAMATADAAALDALLRDVQTGSEAVGKMLTDLAAEAGVIPPEPAGGGGGDDFHATPEPEGPIRCQPGDLWLIGGTHRLLVGDCTDPANVARLLDGGVPFLMVTDPPYGVEYDPKWRIGSVKTGQLNGTPRRGVLKVQNDGQADWATALALFGGEVVYCWHASRHASVVQQGLLDAGFEVRSQIIWRKPNFVISRGHYHFQHEPCWYAVRDGDTARWAGARDQSTVWDIASLQPMGRSQDEQDEPTGHGTQKPVECMARPIRNHGAEGDLVYDPFLGSGTTLIAAHRLGRRCHGCEVDPRYGDVVLKRAEAEGLAAEKV